MDTQESCPALEACSQEKVQCGDQVSLGGHRRVIMGSIYLSLVKDQQMLTKNRFT